jgi:hypothetical protein
MTRDEALVGMDLLVGDVAINWVVAQRIVPNHLTDFSIFPKFALALRALAPAHSYAQ